MSGVGELRPFAVLGDPVAHSLSPRMQNAAFRAAGLPATYRAIRCDSGDLLGVMRRLVASGGGGNVTIPHKGLAATAGRGDPRVEATGAANLFAAGDGDLVVGNTDVDGLLALLDRLEAPPGAWCIVGTGGSARAAVAAAAERGARIAVRSRTPERRAAFLAWARTLGVDSVDDAECEVVINATPVGLRDDDPTPVDLAELPRLRAVADLTYRAAGQTALVRAAADRGVAALDGREMLLVQGAAAWRWWFPGIEVPVEVMRAALEGGAG